MEMLSFNECTFFEIVKTCHSTHFTASNPKLFPHTKWPSSAQTHKTPSTHIRKQIRTPKRKRKKCVAHYSFRNRVAISIVNTQVDAVVGGRIGRTVRCPPPPC